MSVPLGHLHATPRMPNPGKYLSSANQGGRPMNMVVGMATVAASLGAFWMLQFRTENRIPVEMPTWQFLHAQQAPLDANARVGTPGSSKKSNVQSAESGHQRTRNASSRTSIKAIGQEEVSAASLQSYVGQRERGMAPILAMIHGDPNDIHRGRQVGQPAPVRRLNDRGGIYTKNSDYKDSFRRE